MKHVLAVVLSLGLFSAPAWGLVEGSVNGTITDPDGVSLSGAQVELLSPSGRVVGQTTSSATGTFTFFPVTFGNYQIHIVAQNYASYLTAISVASGGSTDVEAHMTAGKPEGGEMVMQVRAKRHLVQNSNSTSRSEVNQAEIKQLPQGDDITLPKLFSMTTPGAVQGPFGQTFFRGNHANIQYQVDGVQLPDSPSNTFGQAFSPRNVDHMEVITGGIPAEYGERLAAVVNIVTKTGAEEPGGSVELNYGSYNTFTPTLTYGGSNESGRLHYYASANYLSTNRGVDTPQPAGSFDEGHGGEEAIHDAATSNSEFLKLDWQLTNSDKITFEGFNSQSTMQIPNYPDSFGPNDPIFTQNDAYGNAPEIYVPSNTNDSQTESNAFAQVVWKHTFNDHTFMQISPYYKYSYILFQNDPANDLFGGANANAYSFYESRNTNNYGLKGDYTQRFGAQNLLKAGFQVQSSVSAGNISLQKQTITATPSQDNGTDHGAFESVYVQDDYNFAKRWTLNIGLRFDATQFSFTDASSSDSSFQPRVGLNYMVTDTTKLHAFYGKLFQPAPLENLRDTLSQVTPGTLAPYDIKAEKDDYYEVGVAQQFLENQVVMVNAYYKSAVNMLDDQQLFNTAIAQPYNYATGFAYGVEVSLKGDITPRWSEYLNYSYEIAKGQGISGGTNAFPANTAPTPGTWTMLDHVQVQTANAGVTYHLSQFWWTTQALYGSGLRTDPQNGSSLPAHITFDTTVGYEFKGDTWASRFKISADVLNILDDPYPISIANGFNGSHYAAGREFFLRLTKEL